MSLAILRLQASSVRTLAYAVKHSHTLQHSTRSFSVSARSQAAVATNGSSNTAEVPSSVEDVDVEEYSKRPPSATVAPSSPSPPPFVESLSDNALDSSGTDWSKSYHGLSSQPFSFEIADILQAPLDPNDVEMKPGRPAIHSQHVHDIDCHPL